MGIVSRRVLAISPQETSFARRGFRCDSAAVRERLEEVGRCFVHGYLAALAADGAAALGARLDAEVARDFRGFAYEGAGMALALRDALAPWRPRRRGRLRRFLAGPGWTHVYIVHVGAGWVLARLPLRVERLLAGLHPLFAWLALDGYGFHQGFFHWPETVAGRRVPRRLRGYARRGFDQGVGRSLWFVEGADPGRIGGRIGAFEPIRQADLWAGVGLATAYAGGVSRAVVGDLCAAAGPRLPALAQGVAFAAKARQWGGNPTPETELACAEVWGATADEVAAVCDRALPPEVVPAVAAGPAMLGHCGGRPSAVGAEVPAFEVWRQAIQEAWREPRQEVSAMGATS